MRGTGVIEAQLNEIERVLNLVNLCEERVSHQVEYIGGVISIERTDGYRGAYEYCVSSRCFDFKLTNQSLLQFAWANKNICTFRYLESPLDIPGYEEFVLDTLEVTSAELIEIGDSLREEYLQYCENAGLKRTILPIRYDYDCTAYKPGSHPAAHIHIGHSTPLRIESERKMNALSFVFFILRHQFPREWLDVLDAVDNDTIARSIRDSLDLVPEEFRSETDRTHLKLC